MRKPSPLTAGERIMVMWELNNLQELLIEEYEKTSKLFDEAENPAQRGLCVGTLQGLACTLVWLDLTVKRSNRQHFIGLDFFAEENGDFRRVK